MLQNPSALSFRIKIESLCRIVQLNSIASDFAFS